MHFVRRTALRAASSPSAIIPKSRSLTTSSPFIARSKIQSSISTSVFRRFASEDATALKEDAISSTATSEASGTSIPTENAAIESNSAAAPIENHAPIRVAEERPRDSFQRPERIITPTSGIYIGNLLFDITAQDLTHEFQSYGKVKNAVIATDTRGLSKGFGYVEFETVAEATAAIEARHQTVLEGRRLVVNYMTQTVRPARHNPPSSTLFIGNLPFEMSDADLNKLFRDIRNVIDVRVAIDRRTGQPRGFAHADFVDVDSAQVAIKQLAGKELYGRKLRADFSSAGKDRRLGDPATQ